jgi:hypothetical protein
VKIPFVASSLQKSVEEVTVSSLCDRCVELEKENGWLKKEREEMKKEREDMKGRAEKAERERDALQKHSRISSSPQSFRDIYCQLVNLPRMIGLIDVILRSSDDEALLISRGLYNSFCNGTFNIPLEEEHPLYVPMKENGCLQKIYEVFKLCQFASVKTMLSLVFMDVHRSVSFSKEHQEMIVWLRDNAIHCSYEGERQTIFFQFHRHIHRSYFSFSSLPSIVLHLSSDCPEEMFNLGIHTFALQFLSFLLSSFRSFPYRSFPSL